MPSFVHSLPKSSVPLSRPKSSIFREAVVGVRRGADGSRLLEVVRAVAPTRVIVMSGREGFWGRARDGGVLKEGRRATAACGVASLGGVRCRTNVLQCGAEPLSCLAGTQSCRRPLLQLSLASGRRQRPTRGKDLDLNGEQLSRSDALQIASCFHRPRIALVGSLT